MNSRTKIFKIEGLRLVFGHLKEKKHFKPIQYPKPDGKITFDKLTNVSFSSTYHEENQPCHLKIIDEKIPISNNYKKQILM